MAPTLRGARPARARRRPRFATNGDRVENGPNSARSWRSDSGSGRTPTWLDDLAGAEIPCGPINDIVAAFESAEAAALGMTVTQEHPAWGAIRQVGVPFVLSETPASIRTPPPTLGEHTDEILASLGYDADGDRRPPTRGVV